VFDGWEFWPYDQERAMHDTSEDNEDRYLNQIMFYDGMHQQTKFNYMTLNRIEGDLFQLYWESYDLPKAEFDRIIGDESSEVHHDPRFVISNEIMLHTKIVFTEDWEEAAEDGFFETRRRWVERYFDLDDFVIKE